MLRTVFLPHSLWSALAKDAAAAGRSRPRQLEAILCERYGIHVSAGVDPSLSWPSASPPDALDEYLSEALQMRKNSYERKRATQAILYLQQYPEARPSALASVLQRPPGATGSRRSTRGAK